MQPQFLTISEGVHSINLAYICEIEWTDEQEATVTMVSGQEYTLEDEDYHALRQALGFE